ncbi:YggS family pyridoxal phosphate-dependent enzyme [candidate division KSB1 bacterium]|nr:YggS family pyridoxal phosphate-dependent enzyme [candidate division KSB1 bacterium]
MIKENIAEILSSLPKGVKLVAAAKTQTLEKVKEAVEAGITVLGYNYLQEAEEIYQGIGNKVQWHMIGHLQRNKAKKAVQLFDMIETVDSFRLAKSINRFCEELGKVMPILIEINSGRESNKAGVFPEKVDELVQQISKLDNIRVQGLMTMGPYSGDPEETRPYFIATKEAFDRLSKTNIPNVEMKYLSMGMSNSYQVAIEEGANMVRIGTLLFGERCW